jgi:uncharacterized membrane protein YdfJ with MMPL/SSD domain
MINDVVDEPKSRQPSPFWNSRAFAAFVMGVFKERYFMTPNAPDDPILRKTEPNDSKPEKRRAGKFVMAAIIIVCVVVVIIYAALIGFSVSGA